MALANTSKERRVWAWTKEAIGECDRTKGTTGQGWERGEGHNPTPVGLIERQAPSVSAGVFTGWFRRAQGCRQDSELFVLFRFLSRRGSNWPRATYGVSLPPRHDIPRYNIHI